MKEQFVTYEIALKLKELGFDEECLCTYGKSDKRFMRNPGTNMLEEPIMGEPYYWKNSKIHESVIASPLWQQVFDWFRITFQLFMGVSTDTISLKCSYDIFINNIDTDKVISYSENTNSDNWTLTYEEAREQAILKAIELIKNNL